MDIHEKLYKVSLSRAIFKYSDVMVVSKFNLNAISITYCAWLLQDFYFRVLGSLFQHKIEHFNPQN